MPRMHAHFELSTIACSAAGDGADEGSVLVARDSGLGQIGLVVTDVPKVTLWELWYFNGLFDASRYN
jgi:hypothetical protein